MRVHQMDPEEERSLVLPQIDPAGRLAQQHRRVLGFEILLDEIGQLTHQQRTAGRLQGITDQGMIELDESPVEAVI